jgi:hypothetical protein
VNDGPEFLKNNLRAVKSVLRFWTPRISVCDRNGQKDRLFLTKGIKPAGRVNRLAILLQGRSA